MKSINSSTNPLIKELSRLKEKKYRHLKQVFLVEGFHLVEEALKAQILKMVLIVDSDRQIENVENILVSSSIIKKLSTTITPQEIIGVCQMKTTNELLGQRFLLLDGVSDPGNLGTLIRCALGFNIETIILGEQTIDLYNEKVIRSSQGAMFHLNIVRKNILEVIKILQTRKIKVIGTSLRDAVLLETVSPLNQFALILGNEGFGVQQEILKETDFNIKIATNEQLESLNVATSGAIIMYHFRKKEKL